MKRCDVIVIGELNVDVIMNGISRDPEIGKEVLAKDMTITIGSSSAIFACNLSSLGASVAMVGKVGSDMFGDFILSGLQSCGVDISQVQVDPQLQTGATIVLNQDEDRANITHQGAMAYLGAEDIQLENFSGARHVHFSSYFLQPGLQPHVPALFRSAKAAGMTTSFDVQWDPEEQWNIPLSEILPFVDVFLPNEKELLRLTRTTSIDEAISQLKNQVNTLVVKRGALGSILFVNGETRNMPAFLNNAVIDAVGAGDSFNAGFIYKYINNAPLEACQEFGNLTGCISTTAAGGTAAFKDIKNRLKDAMQRYGIVSA